MELSGALQGGAVWFALGSFQVTTRSLISGEPPGKHPPAPPTQGGAELSLASYLQANCGEQRVGSNPLLACPRRGSIPSEPGATEQKLGLVKPGLGQSRIKARNHSLKVWPAPPHPAGSTSRSAPWPPSSALPGASPHGPSRSLQCPASDAPARPSLHLGLC